MFKCLPRGFIDRSWHHSARTRKHLRYNAQQQAKQTYDFSSILSVYVHTVS
jgi:hypothetical protein